MASASEGLQEWLTGAPSPYLHRCRLWANATALPYPDDPVRHGGLLSQQASNPVRWQHTIEDMVADGVDTFIEVGPGSTLTNLVGRIDRSVTAHACETPEQLDEVLALLKGKDA